MFTLPSKMTEVSITVCNLKNNKVVGIYRVSTEVLKISLPEVICILNDLLFYFCHSVSSRSV